MLPTCSYKIKLTWFRKYFIPHNPLCQLYSFQISQFLLYCPFWEIKNIYCNNIVIHTNKCKISGRSKIWTTKRLRKCMLSVRCKLKRRHLIGRRKIPPKCQNQWFPLKAILPSLSKILIATRSNTIGLSSKWSNPFWQKFSKFQRCKESSKKCGTSISPIWKGRKRSTSMPAFKEMSKEYKPAFTTRQSTLWIPKNVVMIKGKMAFILLPYLEHTTT